MRSTTGQHFVALDHVRALAVFMVITWHFNHGGGAGFPVPYEHVPSLFPVSVLEEGHTGVSLFMTLSGYLFAKLIDGRRIDYGAFLWNRMVRLVPLLVFVMLIAGILKVRRGEETVASYAFSLVQGFVLPTWPNGAWSIAVELHYYLILPLFLWMLRKSGLLPLAVVAAAIGLRALLHHVYSDILTPSYFTLVGRIDQFALGMIVFHYRSVIAHRHWLALAVIAAFLLFYWQFDSHGGYAQSRSIPWLRALWIFMPTIEGLSYAIAIAWYDAAYRPGANRIASGLAAFFGRLGEYSYSVYLLHVFVVFHVPYFITRRIMDISNLYIACLWSFAFFCLMIIPGYLSYRFIEAPFLRLRRRYFVDHLEGRSPSVPGDAGGQRHGLSAGSTRL